jgi:hypothetical protein
LVLDGWYRLLCCRNLDLKPSTEQEPSKEIPSQTPITFVGGHTGLSHSIGPTPEALPFSSTTTDSAPNHWATTNNRSKE